MSDIDLKSLSNDELDQLAQQRYGAWMLYEVNGAQYSTPGGASQASAAKDRYMAAVGEQDRRAGS